MKMRSIRASSALPTLLAGIAVFALGQFHRASGSVFGPVLSEALDISATSLGLLIGIMFAATLVCQIPAGVALDRFGPRRILLWALGLVACGTALFALAPDMDSAAGSALFTARILLGAGLAATGAGVQMALAQNLPPRDYGYASGLLVTLGGIGGLAGTWPLAVALERLPWVAVFGFSTGVAIFVISVVALLLPSASPEVVVGRDRTIGFVAILKGRETRRLLFLSAVTYAPIVTITGLWGGPYLQDVHGLSPEASGKALMGLFATTIAAGFIFGLIDRIGSGRGTAIVLTAAGSTICLAVLALTPTPPLWAALALLGCSVFLQQFYIPLGVQLKDAVPNSIFGRANALKMLIAVGAIPVMQTAFGLILDLAYAYGLNEERAYRVAFGSMAASIALALFSYSFPGGKDTNSG